MIWGLFPEFLKILRRHQAGPPEQTQAPDPPAFV